ncbi:MAG: cyclic nucleotide-binding domain-containing protein [Candidatus Limnocylindrales bacterium]
MNPDHSTGPGILDALPPKVRAEVLKNARTRTYAPGDVLVKEGDGAMYLFIVDSGHARIERTGAGTVGRFGPGDFFGELALIDKTSRSATVIAEDQLTCHLIPAWEFRALLESHPAMAIPMLHKLIDRLHG